MKKKKFNRTSEKNLIDLGARAYLNKNFETEKLDSKKEKISDCGAKSFDVKQISRDVIDKKS